MPQHQTLHQTTMKRIIKQQLSALTTYNRVTYIPATSMQANGVKGIRMIATMNGNQTKLTSSSSAAASISTSATASKKSIEEVKNIFANSNCVCFDVDSTVVTEEGIDVLADFCGAGPAVAELTRKAMGGSVLFHDALEARLKLIKPTSQQIEQLLNKHPLVLTEKMEELVKVIHSKNVPVYLVSGGFRQMINPVAKKLNIPMERIYANNLLFKENGSFNDFERSEPTSRAGGKAAVIAKLKKEKGYKIVTMIGDGATDLEARPPADIFIGYGGVVVREAVRKGADWYAMHMEELIDAFQKRGGSKL